VPTNDPKTQFFTTKHEGTRRQARERGGTENRRPQSELEHQRRYNHESECISESETTVSIPQKAVFSDLSKNRRPQSDWRHKRPRKCDSKTGDHSLNTRIHPLGHIILIQRVGVRVVGHPSPQYYITVAGQRVDALSQVAPIGRSAATTGRQKTRSEDVGTSGWRAKCEEQKTPSCLCLFLFVTCQPI
jgi:hypothetical protein